MGPPANLLALMVDIARRIVGSRAYRLFSQGSEETWVHDSDEERDLRVPGRWQEERGVRRVRSFSILSEDEGIDEEADGREETQACAGAQSVPVTGPSAPFDRVQREGSVLEERMRRRAWGRLEDG